MTPQERAAAVYRDLGDGCDLSAPEQEKRDIETIAAAFTATRRAALLEAAEFLKLMPMLTKDNAIAVLTKLAQEG